MDMGRRVVLFDSDETYRNLLPLSFTRPVGAFRIGMDTLKEKWEYYFEGEYSWLTRPYLMEKFGCEVKETDEAYFISGNLIADKELAMEVSRLEPGEGLKDDDGLWAWRGKLKDFLELTAHHTEGESSLYKKTDSVTIREADTRGRRINYVFDLFLKNGMVLNEDYRRICRGRHSVAPDESTRVIGPRYLEDGTPALMIEEGADVKGAILNLSGGPIYIGKDVEVMEGSCLHGPLSVGAGTKIRMGAKVYGGTTLGPCCRIGGEIDNTVIFGYSNKAHDGYLGNAVIGEWCNIGAGSNSSNLKNDYSKIRIWNYAQKRFMRTDLQFCGLIMGDHSKAGINTMFNTATVVGVGVNFHGAGFPRTFIPSFTNGSPEGGFHDESVDSFFRVAGTVMRRRGMELNDVDRRIFEAIYKVASEFK